MTSDEIRETINRIIQRKRTLLGEYRKIQLNSRELFGITERIDAEIIAYLTVYDALNDDYTLLKQAESGMII